MMVVAPSPTASPNEEQKPDQHREDYLMSLDRQQAGAHERVSTSEMAPERRSGAGDRAEIRSAAADASPERWRKSVAHRGSARADRPSSQSPRADPNLPDEMPPLLVQFEQAEMSPDPHP